MPELSIAIAAEDEGKTVRFIALRRLQMSCGQFKRAKFQGELLLGGERVHADRRVTAGQTLTVRIPETAAASTAAGLRMQAVRINQTVPATADIGLLPQTGCAPDPVTAAIERSPYPPTDRVPETVTAAVERNPFPPTDRVSDPVTAAVERSPYPPTDCVPETVSGVTEIGLLPLAVAYEDDDLLIIDKPAPLPSVRSPKQGGITLENAVFAYLGAFAGFPYRPVNRLDKGTSGLMVIAKHAHAQQFMQRMLHTDAFVREYLAVCDGVPPAAEGVIDAPVAKADGASIRRVISEQGRPARTDYRVERIGNGRSLLRLRLHTGRTHQIRVHLQSIGCPVTGDFLYGAEHPLLPRRFALHSAFLELVTPKGKNIRLESPPPDVFLRLLYSEPLAK